jgi:hypothetical protein
VYNHESDKILGWINFIKDSYYKNMAKAKDFTIIYELDKNIFLTIIKEFKPDFYKMM